MSVLSVTIEIEASPERVWCILTDVDRYTQWNPRYSGIEGELKVGMRPIVHINRPSTPLMRLMRGTYTPTILTAEPPRELSWVGRLLVPGLLDGVHRFIIEELNDNHVLFTQNETFRGPITPIHKLLVYEHTRRSFEEMNKALKARAENREIVCE